MLLSRSLICPSNPQMHTKGKVLVIYSLGTIPGHWKSTHNCHGKMLHWLQQAMVQLIPSRASGITVQHRSEWWPACPTHTFLQHFYLLKLCTLTSLLLFSLLLAHVTYGFSSAQVDNLSRPYSYFMPQAYGKMFNTTNHWGKCKSKPHAVSLHTQKEKGC